MRAATPGTVLVLVAAICLLLATISTPIIKNFSFLQASAANSNRVVRLGCLGYCAGSKCSPVTLGYDLDGASSLLGVPNIVPANWSDTIIKGLTYTLVLHPVALGAAVVVLIMGLISHCTNGRACCTSVIAGLASTLAILAFGLDCALFIIAKKRIESQGGTATLGAGLWLTLAAAVLLFVSTCAFSCGSCCGGGGRREKKLKDSYGQPAGNGGFVGDQYGERMRMDAIEAERRRKNGGESDLPKFAVYETEHIERLPAHEEQMPLRDNYYEHNQQNYAPHGQDAHHDPYAAPYPVQGQYDNSPVTGYAAGVGPGHRRGPSQPSPGFAGYGAHAPARAASTAPSAVSHDAVYTPGVGPQPYRDGAGSGFGTPAAMAAVGAGAGAGYAAYEASPRRQPTADSGYHGQQSSAYGHPTEGTFGMPVPQRSGSTVSYAHADGGAYEHDARASSAYGHAATPSSGYGHAMSPSQTMDVYGAGGAKRAPSQVAPGGGSRRLPTVPMGDAESRRQPTADDGFGLAVLQAGAAARARDEEQLRSPMSPHEDAHRAAVDAAFAQHLAQHNQSQQQQQQQYGHAAQQSSYHDAQQEGYAYGGEEHGYYAHDGGYGEGSSSAGPPGYDWHDQQGQGQHGSSGYPQEKR